MATELKSDAWHRYMMYRSDDTSLMPFAPEETRHDAIEAGKKFTGDAYADVWAKDASLVGRIRQFLGGNFHWHERLARSGSDLEVVEMLQYMVRGGSIVVIPQEHARGDGGASVCEKPRSSFWGADQYSHIFEMSVADRYRAQLQLETMNAGGPTLAEIRAMNDSINTQFMHAAVLADPLGTLPLFARAGWVSRYGLPDLSEYGSEPMDQDPTTPFANAQPFEYATHPSDDGDIIDIAARGVSDAQEAECDAMYEARMTYCSALSKMYGNDARTYLACKQQAFQDYQACRGYR